MRKHLTWWFAAAGALVASTASGQTLSDFDPETLLALEEVALASVDAYLTSDAPEPVRQRLAERAVEDFDAVVAYFLTRASDTDAQDLVPFRSRQVALQSWLGVCDEAQTTAEAIDAAGESGASGEAWALVGRCHAGLTPPGTSPWTTSAFATLSTPMGEDAGVLDDVGPADATAGATGPTEAVVVDEAGGAPEVAALDPSEELVAAPPEELASVEVEREAPDQSAEDVVTADPDDTVALSATGPFAALDDGDAPVEDPVSADDPVVTDAPAEPAAGDGGDDDPGADTEDASAHSVEVAEEGEPSEAAAMPSMTDEPAMVAVVESADRSPTLAQGALVVGGAATALVGVYVAAVQLPATNDEIRAWNEIHPATAPRTAEIDALEREAHQQNVVASTTMAVGAVAIAAGAAWYYLGAEPASSSDAAPSVSIVPTRGGAHVLWRVRW